jgi:carboxyl-terminal processing protease
MKGDGNFSPEPIRREIASDGKLAPGIFYVRWMTERRVGKAGLVAAVGLVFLAMLIMMLIVVPSPPASGARSSIKATKATKATRTAKRKRRPTTTKNVVTTMLRAPNTETGLNPPPASAATAGTSAQTATNGPTTTLAPPASTIPLPTPAIYLADALTFVERYSVRRNKIDVRAITDKARVLGVNAKSIEELYPILRQVTKDLGDRHSAFLDPTQARSLTQGSGTGFGLRIYPPDVIWVVPGSPAEVAGIRTLDRIISFNGKSWAQLTATDRTVDVAVVRVSRKDVGELEFSMQRGELKTAEMPTVRALDNRLGYIDLPGATGKADDEARFAAAGSARIAVVEQQISPCGWVVDLRRNTGGFPFSMMSPLESFMPDQTIGGFVYGDDKRESLRFNAGKVLIDNRVVWTNTSPARLANPNVSVAVLVSNQTGSAGEIAMIAFIGRPSSRSFGIPTVGVTSANVGITLPDGSFIMVTHSYDLDRAGNVYDGPLKPDENVPLDWTVFATTEDPVLNAAKTWLSSQPSCG